MKRPASALTALAITLSALGTTADSAQAYSLPVYQYKLFCKALAKGHAVMTSNCETQEVLSFRQLQMIWQTPPAPEIQKKCYANNAPDARTGSGSYVKFLNCITTNTGNG